MLNCYLATGLLVAATWAAATTARAQADFRPGYLVRPAGDTVRGEIDYRSARRNAVVCQFRPAPGAPIQLLHPADLQGYSVLGQGTYHTRLTPLPDSAGRPRAPRFFFLEVLAEGPPATLYQRRAGTDESHYYVQNAPAAPLTELTVTHQSVTDGTHQYYQDIPTFRGVLSAQFADCPSVLLSLAKTEFKPTSLIAAVQRYNACREPGAVAKQVYKAPSRVGVEVLLGAQASQLNAYGYLSPASGNFQAGLAPEVGVGLTYSSQTVRNKLQLRLEAHYVRQHYEDEYQFTSTTGGGSAFLYPYSYQTRFQTDYLRVPLLLRYLPLTGKVQPLLEVGGSVSPLLQLTQESRYHTNASTTYGSWVPAYDPADVRHLEFGLLAGVGVQVNGLAGHSAAVLGRLESSNGFLATPVNYTKVLRYQVLLTIGLTKQQ